MRNRVKLYILTGIIVLAAILRLYQLGSIPPSPDWDEAALGYNGYAILHTGRDEYGKFLPVVLRSFDDYKPALYAYLTIPSTALFGLNVFATRLPSAIFGILTVYFVYLLVKELFKKEDLALLSAGLFAISPWHIQLSRIAFETNVGLAFNIMTAYFFVRALKKPWLLSIAAITSALAIYTYQSEKVFTPLLLAALVLIYLKDFIRIPKKFLVIAIICGATVIAPMLFYISTNKQALLRAQATLAFSDTNDFLKNQVIKLDIDSKNHDILGKVVDNRRVLYLITGASGYLSHYDLNWLFIRGDLNRHHAPGMGLLYLWELPFFLIGLYRFVLGGYPGSDRRSKYLILAWFLLAAVPAAFTSGVPHAVRTLNFLPTHQIFTAWGILVSFVYLYKRTRPKIYIWFIKSGSLLFVIFILFNIFYYLNQYFVQQNYFNSMEWQYGHKQAIDYIKSVESKYKKIIVSDREPLDQAHMFYLFYLQIPPQQYLAESKSQSGGFKEEHKFGKYEFRPIDFSKEKVEADTLYVGHPSEMNGRRILRVIRYLDGTPAIIIGVK